jgi:glucose-6-phosphate isomerase, archaeal
MGSLPEKNEMRVDLSTGELSGGPVQHTVRTVKDLQGIFHDEAARLALDPAQTVYRVQAILPAPEGRPGELFWGTTFIEPGMVGDEYFMTKGHFHADRSRTEFYLTVAGSGALILMDEDHKTRFEPMEPGSLHYIPPHTAHRTANVGGSMLSFLACWPSDAGHDYAAIASAGFSARLRSVHGTPTLVEES